MFTATQVLSLAVLLVVSWSWLQLYQDTLQPDAYTPGPRAFLSHGGWVRGTWGLTAAGKRYRRFLGIPYAEPPTGEGRFAPPEPAQRWVGEKQAKAAGPVCPQPTSMLPGWGPFLEWLLHPVAGLLSLKRRCHQSEDCLSLSVHVPPGANLSAVLVWIHGQAVASRDEIEMTEEYDPGPLLDEDVVVVVPQYRVGVLGFLRAGPYSGAPGNAGLRDQALALQWVRDHVRGFGGDPNRVTIWGAGMGAVSVHLHTIAPHSAGLFQQAILSSGVSLAPWALQRAPRQALAQLLECLHLPVDGPNDAVQALRAVPLDQLVPRTENPCLPTQHWLPVVEDAPDDVQRFLPQDPLAVMGQGSFRAVPSVMGINSREGLAWLLDRTAREVRRSLRRVDTHFKSVLDDLPLLRRPLATNQTQLAARLVRSHFFGSQRVSLHTLPAYLDLYSDLMYNIALHESIGLHLRKSPHQLFVYRFSFDGRLGFLKKLLNTNIPGTAHAEELGYLFQGKLPPSMPLPEDSPEIRTRDRLVRLWTNFIKFGNPTPKCEDACDGFLWEPTSSENNAYLDIDEDIVMRREMFAARAKFWKGLYTDVLQIPVHW